MRAAIGNVLNLHVDVDWWDKSASRGVAAWQWDKNMHYVMPLPCVIIIRWRHRCLGRNVNQQLQDYGCTISNTNPRFGAIASPMNLRVLITRLDEENSTNWINAITGYARCRSIYRTFRVMLTEMCRGRSSYRPWPRCEARASHARLWCDTFYRVLTYTTLICIWPTNFHCLLKIGDVYQTLWLTVECSTDALVLKYYVNCWCRTQTWYILENKLLY
jgi:hypothetical protein